MIRFLSALSVLVLLSSCQQPPRPDEVRSKITLDELAIEVHGQPRTFMMSDKRGGFIVGGVNSTSPQLTWSIGGREVLSGCDILVNDVQLPTPELQSTTILPHVVQHIYASSIRETVAPLEYADSTGAHALLIRIRTEQPSTITLKIKPAAGFVSQRTGGETSELIFKQAATKSTMTAYAGEQGKAAGGNLVVSAAREVDFVLLFGDPHDRLIKDLHANVRTYEQVRADRMEELLNGSYLRTSDARLDKAMHWMQLSLDALVVEAEDTVAVASVPWDGSLDLRDNARSIAGLNLALGKHRIISGMIRTIAQWQDTVVSRPTYGRIADNIAGNSTTYRGADVTPWFVREMFGYVTWTNDTALARSMYPLVKRGMEGTLKYHTDSLNFLVHGDDETWMNSPGSPRGNRAAEIQLLWYFQQLISSYIATHVLDLDHAQQWSQHATQTVKNFSLAFVDTARHLVYDHLTKEGKGILEARPNAMYCLEMMGSELVEQSVVRETFNTLAYPQGVGTLASLDKRFQASANAASGFHNGPIWTWLTGQLTYALTRFDRQDLSYQLTRALVQEVLDGNMAGALPSVLAMTPRTDDGHATRSGLDASLSGMAELVRGVYQDYIGISIDVPSSVISLNPKLPDTLKTVDCTVLFGDHPIHIKYVREEGTSRVTVEAPGAQGDIKVRFMWMMENGNAWKGTTTLHAPNQLKLVFTEDDAIAFDGGNETPLQYRQKLAGFSQRKDYQGLEFAKIPSSISGAR